MKSYLFKKVNKEGNIYFFYKNFPSAYCADRWQVKVLNTKNISYVVVFKPGYEKPVNY